LLIPTVNFSHPTARVTGPERQLQKGETEMSELLAPLGAPPEVVEQLADVTEAARRTPVLITEQQVLFATAAAALTTPNAQIGAALQGEVQLLATVSTAEIPLPDPVAYRRDWTNYRIRLTFGTPPGDVETREIAAPEPPPPG